MTPLNMRLAQLRHRLLSISAITALLWALLAALVFLLLAAWLDLLWELPPPLRVAVFWSAIGVGVLLFCLLAILTLLAARAAQLARRLDRAGGAKGTIFTAWELAEHGFGIAGVAPQPLSVGLATVAIDQAATEAAKVPLHRAAPLRPLGRSTAVLAILGVVIAVVALCLPKLAQTQWNRFWHPLADIPPFSLTEFDVKPGTTDAIYGSELEIRTLVRGTPVDQLELVLHSAEDEQSLPMFQESSGAWRAVLAKVTEPANYFVRAYRARSHIYHINVITVPLLENVRVRVVPPAYASRAPYDGPVPKDGISGLRDTKVQVFLRSNRPLSGGTISLAGSPQPPAFPMKPLEPGSQEVMGEFPIHKDGKFECRVIDTAGQLSQQSCSGNITLLSDERPFVRIMQPEKVSLATPNAVLPVLLSAEDDCGIMRLELFRNLNDSRPLPAEMAMPAKIVRRVDGTVGLPLHQYGLAPGDVIKLFARVEDNDPAGRKGSESSITTVRIISEADLERMMRAREGIDAFVSKYYEARRQLESMANELDTLRKKYHSLPPGDKVTQQMLEEIQRLEQQIRKQLADLRRSAQRLTDFDLDKNLMPHLNQLLDVTESMANSLQKLAKERDLINKKLGGRLDKLAEQLAAERKRFESEAVEPIRHLEAIFPLMVDQNRFVQLVLWQQDLAERMVALKGHDGEDNPTLKSRMRDLEQEQWQVREALMQLLDDIQEHSQQLPDEPELKTLRDTAQQFAADVRASGATVAMVAAEAALSEFAPTRAHEKAKEAADILFRFLKGCNNVGNCANKTLAFQPSLCKNLGNTVNQLLAGMGSGSGNGMGGYSSVGLYGQMPAILAVDGDRGNAARNSRRGGQHARKLSNENPDEMRPGDATPPDASASTSEGNVPAQYRRQVGQYFERVAEETGDTGH